MSAKHATAKNFFQRAEHEAHRYGEDIWVFLRELVQNSRDAEARQISITAQEKQGWQIITCRDDGMGMDQQDLERYLLRLYASSKEKENNAVGFFGVGFWSVLLFKPDIIRVSSCSEGQPLAFEIKRGEDSINPIATELFERGTQVTLYRRSKPEDTDRFEEMVSQRLSYYVGHLRPLSGQNDLTLYCNGVQVNRPFPLPELMGGRFRTKDFDGVLGFGDAPRVRIYKGGILVRDLLSLNEVIPSRRDLNVLPGMGLFPQIYINIDGLRVLMDRQKIYEDPLLYKAVVFCEKRLLNTQKRLVQGLFPMNLKNRMMRWKKNARSSLKLLLGVPILLLCLLALAYRLVPQRSAPAMFTPPPDPTAIAPDRALENWQGSLIDSTGSDSFDWDFQYDNNNPYIFRMRTFSHFDVMRGFFPVPHKQTSPYPGFTAPPEKKGLVRITTGISKGAPFALPVPPGHVLLKGSLLTESGNSIDLWMNQFGEPVVQTKTKERVSYKVIPQNWNALPLRPEDPRVLWPPQFQALLDQAQSLPTADAVDKFSNYILENFTYSRDPHLADSFNTGGNTWMEKVTAAQAGDCDILNGLLILFLRAHGIDAHLTVGLVGRQGRAMPELHAWARYYDSGWHQVDLTRHSLEAAQSPPPKALTPVSSPFLSANNDLPEALTNPPMVGSAGPPPEVIAQTPELPVVEAISPSQQPSDISIPRETWWLLLLPLLAVVAYLLLRGRHKPSLEQSVYVTNLLQHHLSSGGHPDPLQLKFRPVFPLLSGGLVSLIEVQKLAHQGRLFGAFPGAPMLGELKSNAVVLNRSADVVTLLETYLPDITWLEDAQTLINTQQKSPMLAAAAETIRGLDPDFRLHETRGTHFKETWLPFKDKTRGSRHLFLGSDHPFHKTLTNAANDGLFRVVLLILNKTTFYMGEKDRFLMELAREYTARGTEV